MKNFLCLLSVMFPLLLFGQAVSRTELKNTNTLIDARMALGSNAVLSTVLTGERFGAHITNSVNSSNLQFGVNYLDSIGGGTFIVSTNRGTLFLTNLYANPGHSGHRAMLILSNRNPIRFVIPDGVVLQAATNSQITGTASNDIIAVYNSTNLTIEGGGTITGGPTNAQPNWTGGYAQASNGSAVFAKNAKNFLVRNLTINGGTHSSHGNVYVCTDCLNPTTENLSTFNGGEGILFIRATNVQERFCSYSDPLNVNVGDAHEFADCDIVNMVGCKAFGTNVVTGGSAIDTFGSQNVTIDGFNGDFVAGFAGQPSDLGQNRNVQVSNSRFKVHRLAQQNSGLGGWGATRNFANYKFVNTIFEGGNVGLQSSSNFLGIVDLIGCQWLNQTNAGVYIDGAGIWNFHGGEIRGVTAGPGLQAYGNNIADIGSNGPTLNFYGFYIRSNSTYGVAIASQAIANYHVQGDWVGQSENFLQGNVSGTYSVDGGTTDNINRNLPTDFNVLKGATNASGVFAWGNNTGTRLITRNNGQSSSGIAEGADGPRLFTGTGKEWAIVNRDGASNESYFISFTNGTIYLGSAGTRSMRLSYLGRLNLGGQTKTNDAVRIYDDASIGTNFMALGMDDLAQGMRVYFRPGYDFRIGQSDGNSNFITRFRITATGQIFDGNGSQVVTNSTGIDSGAGSSIVDPITNRYGAGLTFTNLGASRLEGASYIQDATLHGSNQRTIIESADGVNLAEFGFSDYQIHFPQQSEGIPWIDGSGLFSIATIGSGLDLTAGTLTATGTGTPGGNSGDLQFNQAGVFAGTNTVNWDRTNALFRVRGGIQATNPVGTTILEIARATGGSGYLRWTTGGVGVASWRFLGDGSGTAWYDDVSNRFVALYRTDLQMLTLAPSNVAVTHNLSVGGTQTNAGAVNNGGPVTNWNLVVGMSQFPGQATADSYASTNGNGNFFTRQSGQIVSNMTVLYPTNTPVGLTRPITVLSNLVYGVAGSCTGQLCWVEGSSLGGSSITDPITNQWTGIFTNKGIYIAEPANSTTNLDFAARDSLTNFIAIGTTAVGFTDSNIGPSRVVSVDIVNRTNEVTVGWPETWIWNNGKPSTLASNGTTTIIVRSVSGRTNAMVADSLPIGGTQTNTLYASTNSLDLANVAAGGVGSVVWTVPGAAQLDVVSAAWTNIFTGGNLKFIASNDTVHVVLENYNAVTAIDLPPSAFRVRVDKFK